MKKRCWIICGLIVFILAIYLNRSYAYIFDKIGIENLKSSDMQYTYNFGKESNDKLAFVAMGDSLTAGVGVDNFKDSYTYQVAQKISEKNKNVVLNVQALPGAKSVDLVEDYLDSTIGAKPDLITILIGVNDVYGNISLKDFQKNYEIILKRLTSETKAKIYIVNIPFIGSSKLILPPYNWYYNFQIQKFNTALEKLAVDYNVNYIDLYSPIIKAAKEDSYYSVDLFHPSRIGYKLWSQIIYDGLNK